MGAPEGADTGHISIHALLTESDPQLYSVLCCDSISIHALLTESDGRCRCWVLSDIDFYPRSPYGERPLHLVVFGSDCRFLSTLSLRRATAQDFTTLHDIFISIHALLTESDLRGVNINPPSIVISIHALLTESDLIFFIFDLSLNHFYPRSPYGERPSSRNNRFAQLSFLSTLSLRRATPGGPRPPAPPRHFYPRSPYGERPRLYFKSLKGI